MKNIDSTPIEQLLEKRLGSVHARQRMGIEDAANQKVFGGGLNYFHPENWYSVHKLISFCLKISGFYWLGRRNARRTTVSHNRFEIAHLPAAFEGYRLLHLSDLHVDLDEKILQGVINAVRGLQYDCCVLTGDYRALTAGSFDAAMAGMQKLMAVIDGPVYAVLGNHDSIRMVPGLEAMGIRMLINESVQIEKEGAVIHICGIDDAHYFRVDNFQKTLADVPAERVSVLLSHTPEVYRQAGHAAVDVFLCGHTHGGQICLPGGYPLTLDAECPRFVGSGYWRYRQMQGYTSRGAGASIVNVRLNCPPEVTLHTLAVSTP